MLLQRSQGRFPKMSIKSKPYQHRRRVPWQYDSNIQPISPCSPGNFSIAHCQGCMNLLYKQRAQSIYKYTVLIISLVTFYRQ